MELVTAFRCNASQILKALTGVEYHSSPHHYKPKSRPSQKRGADEGKTLGQPQPKKPKGTTATIQTAAEDTLSSESSSSSSDLPTGLYPQTII